jgi:hypothetical protein
MYKEIPIDPLTNKTYGILRLTDMTFIPFDPANTDYQEFLHWCEQGNTPEPADE